MKYSKLSLAVLMGLSLTACGGGSSGSDSSSDGGTNVSPSTYNINAYVADENATAVPSALVCLDLNGSGSCDASEPKNITDNQGSVSITGVSEADYNKGANVIALDANNKVLYAVNVKEAASPVQRADESTNDVTVYLNPVTNFVQQYAKNSAMTFAEAQADIAKAFNIADPASLNTIAQNTPVALRAFAQASASLPTPPTISNSTISDYVDDYNNVADTLAKNQQVTIDIVINIVINNGGFDFDDSDIDDALNNNLPKGDFTYDDSECALVKFTANITDPDNDSLKFDWDFGDGSEHSTLQNPEHLYTSSGTYNVLLTVTDKVGNAKFKKTITVDTSCSNTNVTPQFTYQPDQANPLVVKFTGPQVGEDVTYSWNFGDGSTSSEQNPTHQYAQTGIYSVKLEVTVNGETKSHTEEVIVDVAANNTPVADFLEPVIDGLNVKITNTSTDADNDALNYEWTVSDGTKVAAKDFDYTFESAGTYSITLKVSDEKASATKQVQVTVSDASFDAQIKTLRVEGRMVTLAAEVPSSVENPEFTWIMGDGSAAISGPEVSYEYAQDGTYNVQLTVKSGETQISKIMQVTVAANNTAPVASFEIASQGEDGRVTFINNSSDQDGDSLTYLWDFGDNSTSTEESPVHTYELPNEDVTYAVKLTVSDGKLTNSSTKSVSFSKSSDIVLPKASFTASVNGTTVTFTNQSTADSSKTLTYYWDFGDGSSSTEMNPVHKYNTTVDKTYKVVLTVSDSVNTAEHSLDVAVKGASVVDPSNNAPVVDFHYKFTGLSGVLTPKATDADGDTLTYSWDFGDGLTSTSKIGKVTYTSGGKKTINLTVSDGKTSTTKTYEVNLANVEVVLPQKEGLYLKTEYTHLYMWVDNTPLVGEWPGGQLSQASESTSWKYYDTSAISQASVSMILSNGGNGQTPDLTGLSPQGCFADNKVIPLSECSLSAGDAQVVEGGCELGGTEGGETILTGEITWGALDYGTYTSTSDVYVESAPFVMTDLAPGSYHETKEVTLSLQDADRNATSGTIYYTLDNSKPSEESEVYSGPITLEDTSSDGLGTAYRLRTLAVGDNGMKQEQSFFWFVKNDATVAPATDFRDETIYFVLTARYFDGDESNNYYCRDRFDPEDPSWRGDFKGLIEKLDYIKDMGFTAIWITPPIENRSGLDYHGYHGYDWFQPDLRLESPGATYFDFIKAAHEKGIKVVQDVVLNHSSNYGIRGQVYIEKIPTKYYIDPAFGKNGIDNGPYQKNIGDYVSYTRCDNDNYVAPVWHRRVCAGDPEASAEFTIQFKDHTVNVNNTSTEEIDARYFWSPAVQNYLPEKWYHVAYTNNWESVEEVQQRSMAGDCIDLKTESENVRDYMNAAIRMYIDMGIDAIRIDTLKHMPREDVMAMTSTWQKYKPGMFVFGEALIKGFGDNTPSELLPWYYTRTSSADAEKSGDSGISVLDFSLMSTFRDNVTKGGLNGIADVFNRFDSWYADPTKLVTFFQNHDLTPDNTWSGSGAQHCCSDRRNSALAYNVLWTVRGIPVLYAGDERGVRIGLPPDLTNSSDLVKDTGRIYIGDSFGDSTADSDPIIGHITDLNAIRKTSKALQRGTLKVLANEPLVFERQYESERAIVAIVGSGGGNVTVDGATDGSYTDVVTGTKYTVSGGSVALGDIPGSSMRVLVKDYTGGKVTGKSEFLK